MSTFAPPLLRTVARSPKSRDRLSPPGRSGESLHGAAFEPFVAHQRSIAAGLAPPVAAEAPRVQAKLRIGGTDDRFEREADQIADQVVAGMRPSVPTRGAGDGSIRRKCDACAEEDNDDEKLQRKPLASASTSPGPGIPVSPAWSGRLSQVRAQQGRGLPAGVRSYMEPRLGADLSAVRLHDDAGSAALARTIHARAFTVGRDVFFGAGEYRPGTTPGQHLLAHELVHTLQNSRTTIRRSPAPEQRLEPAQARKLVIDWIANVIVALAAGSQLSEAPHGIARRIVAGPFAGEADGRKVSLEQFAASIASGQEVGVSETLLRAILRESGLQLSLAQAQARLEAARLAAPLLQGFARPGVQSLLEARPDPFEEKFAEPEAAIEVPSTDTAAASTAEERAEEPTVAPPMNQPQPKGSDDRSVRVQGGIAVLSAPGASGSGAYIPAGTVTLGRKNDARLRSAVEDEARFGLFACFPDLSPVRAAALLSSAQLRLEIPPVDKLRAHGVTEVTVAMDVPGLAAKLEMESRCKGGKSLVELGNARTLGQMMVAMDVVAAGMTVFGGGGLMANLEQNALVRAERRLAKSKARAAKREGAKQRKAMRREEANKKKKKEEREKVGDKGKWGCQDVRCNVYPDPQHEPMVTTCPKRVFGWTPYIHPNFDKACKAAQKVANAVLTGHPGCIKRHCNCDTKCSRK